VGGRIRRALPMSMPLRARPTAIRAPERFKAHPAVTAMAATVLAKETGRTCGLLFWSTCAGRFYELANPGPPPIANRGLLPRLGSCSNPDRGPRSRGRPPTTRAVCQSAVGLWSKTSNPGCAQAPSLSQTTKLAGLSATIPPRLRTCLFLYTAVETTTTSSSAASVPPLTRKNALFAAPTAGAKRWATIASPRSSDCNLLGVEPYAYLADAIPQQSSTAPPQPTFDELCLALISPYERPKLKSRGLRTIAYLCQHHGHKIRREPSPGLPHWASPVAFARRTKSATDLTAPNRRPTAIQDVLAGPVHSVKSVTWSIANCR